MARETTRCSLPVLLLHVMARTFWHETVASNLACYIGLFPCNIKALTPKEEVHFGYNTCSIALRGIVILYSNGHVAAPLCLGRAGRGASQPQPAIEHSGCDAHVYIVSLLVFYQSCCSVGWWLWVAIIHVRVPDPGLRSPWSLGS